MRPIIFLGLALILSSCMPYIKPVKVRYFNVKYGTVKTTFPVLVKDMRKCNRIVYGNGLLLGTTKVYSFDEASKLWSTTVVNNASIEGGFYGAQTAIAIKKNKPTLAMPDTSFPSASGASNASDLQTLFDAAYNAAYKAYSACLKSKGWINVTTYNP